jgi:hypothetical protein
MEREPNCSRVLEEDGAHALALVRRAHGEIGEIADLSKITERAPCPLIISIPRGDAKIGVAQHDRLDLAIDEEDRLPGRGCGQAQS